MASVRNTYFRCIHRNLLNYAQHRWKLTKLSSPSVQLFHEVPDILQIESDPAFQSFNGLVCGSRFSTVFHRQLCVASNVISENQATKKPEESTSEQGEKSEDSRESGEAGKPVRGGPISWLSFLLLVTTGAGLIIYYDKEKKRHIEEINDASTAVKQGPSVGKAAIGGPFNLVNQDGKCVTDKDFLGKWTLVYFGFTHCPDICPDELQKLATAIDKIKEKAGIEVVPVFISVDPERDTVEQVHEYVKEFHPNLIGLTGNADEIRKVARAYRVYYMKTEEEGSDYLVDHSIIMYLMSPDMEFVKFFGKNYDVDQLTEGVIKELKEHKK
ncbi:protein SCO1 homolog 1, mitochondrial-like [Telopea speciosissima]|uniref:protein SCO1 homolog 1, mitochondrial-like n=1 Tax=Telopea speciosissima TaxID=54955 RepID=UPI001CC6F883|nr:protein SCO1 homolog 1, mitochondrial-like [Telopea speciosissima]XP_043724278.1 protein SCO1 homolog 1, mitochondrial-like [Telopea speciosissima]